MKKLIPALLFVLLIVAFLGIATYTKNKGPEADLSIDRQRAIDELIARPAVTVNAKHQYKDGEHTYVGMFEVPTPCYVDDVEVIKRDDYFEIAINYSENKDEDTICAQVIEDRNFKVTFEGEEDDKVDVTINGEFVNFNISEVGEYEDINDPFIMKG